MRFEPVGPLAVVTLRNGARKYVYNGSFIDHDPEVVELDELRRLEGRGLLREVEGPKSTAKRAKAGE